MYHRSLLFPGVLFITAIASLLIVQSCAKHDRAGTNDNRAGTNHDLQREYASAQTLSYVQGCYMTNQKPSCDRYKKYKSILTNWCQSNDEAACKFLLQLQKIEGSLKIKDDLSDLIGK
jgi:hypothetical protein